MVLSSEHSQNLYPHCSKEGGWGMGRRQGDAEGKGLSLSLFLELLVPETQPAGLAAAQALT